MDLNIFLGGIRICDPICACQLFGNINPEILSNRLHFKFQLNQIVNKEVSISGSGFEPVTPILTDIQYCMYINFIQELSSAWNLNSSSIGQ